MIRDFLDSYIGVLSLCLLVSSFLLLVIYFTWGRWYDRPIGRHRAGVHPDPPVAPPAATPDRWERYYRINRHTLESHPVQMDEPLSRAGTALIQPGYYFDEVNGVMRFYDEFGRPVDWSGHDDH